MLRQLSHAQTKETGRGGIERNENDYLFVLAFPFACGSFLVLHRLTPRRARASCLLLLLPFLAALTTNVNPTALVIPALSFAVEALISDAMEAQEGVFLSRRSGESRTLHMQGRCAVSPETWARAPAQKQEHWPRPFLKDGLAHSYISPPPTGSFSLPGALSGLTHASDHLVSCAISH